MALDAADHVYFVGPYAKYALRVKNISENKTLQSFSTVKELSSHLKSFLSPDDLVLLKASGADHLARVALMYEQVVACWREECGRENMCDKCKLLSIA